jgi:hypothetical protein
MNGQRLATADTTIGIAAARLAFLSSSRAIPGAPTHSIYSSEGALRVVVSGTTHGHRITSIERVFERGSDGIGVCARIWEIDDQSLHQFWLEIKREATPTASRGLSTSTSSNPRVGVR